MVNKKVILILFAVIFVSVIGYSFYIFNLEKYLDLQDTLVYGQQTVAPGSLASLRVATVNHKNSEPIPGAAITVAVRDIETRQETPLFEGESTQLGSPDIEFRIPENLEGDYDLIITTDSKFGRDEILKTIHIARSFKVLLTTDKPLYQPGQTMHIRALAVNSADSTPVKNQEVTIEVEDAKGNKVFKKKLQTSEFGIVGSDFTLAHEIHYGRYTIRAVVGDDSTEKKVEVKKYVLPKFKIDFTTVKTYYLPKQTVVGTVQTHYFFGKPTHDADVNVKIYTYEINMELIGNVKGTTDSNGVFTFEYELPDHFVGLPLEKGAGLLFFDISVIDQAEHTEEMTASVPIAKDPITIELIPESGELEKGLANIVYVITTYPDGTPAPSTVTIKGQQIQTNRFGIGEFTIKPEEFFVEIEATAQDEQGNTGSVRAQFPRDFVKDPQTEEEWRKNQRYFSNIYRTESVLLRVDRSLFDVGDTVHVNVFCTSSSGTVYVDAVRNKQTILTKALGLKNGSAALDLDLDESMTGTLEFHAYKILRNADIVRDNRTIFVNQRRDLELAITSDKTTYLPGEEATITFSTSKDKVGLPTAIGVNIVDESVFALQEKEAGFERLYFELEKELMTPRYMIYGVTLPKLIYEEQPVMDEQIRVQAGNILMAAAPTQDRFPLQVSSRREKEEEIKRKKERYFGTLFKCLTGILLFIPVIIVGITIYGHRHEKKTLLKNFGLSILLLLGVTLFVIFLFWFLGETLNSIVYEQEEFFYGIVLAILVIVLISTIIAAVWSGKRQYFKTFFISSTLLPIQLVLVLSLLMGVLEYRYEGIILLLTAIITVIIVVASLVLVIRYARKKDQSLLWITIFYTIYLIIFPVFVSVGMFIGLLESVTTILWVGGITMLLPIIYAIYTVDFLRKKNKMAVSTFIIAFLLLILIVPMIIASRMRMASPMRTFADMEAIGTALGSAQVDHSAFPSAGITETGSKTAPRIRQFFPETLYSNPQIITDQHGQASIHLQVADSITSWRITALANALNGDIGSNNAGMVVFQDFFVDIDLPVSLTQEDEISIPISVFNYLDTPQTVKLTFQEEAWFELLDISTKTLDIEANDIDVVYFRIKAKKPGNQKFTVSAYGKEKSDAISRVIEIVPNGKEFRPSWSDKLSGDVEQTITVPQSAIEDSEKLFVKIYPGIFSQVVEGLDSMLRMPYGCFEQTSSITYPNALVLDYMKTTNQITSEIRMKAEHYITTGYQRLMTFEATPGGFSIFGKKPAEKIVTAYGLLEFTDMSNIYDIDDRLIPRVQEWLLKQMEADHWTPDGGYGAAYKARNSNVAATAYISWSLLHSGLPPEHEKIRKALDYIEQNYTSEHDNPYALGLCALALSKGQRNPMPILERLDELANREDKFVYWTSLIDDDGGKSQSSQAQADVETTAVVALAYLEADFKPHDVTKTLHFLIKSKDSYGTWGSTQATVLTLKALLDSIAKATEKTDARITVFVDHQKVHELRVDHENNDVLHLVDLKKYAKRGDTHVKLSLEGEGNLFYQLVSSYYLPWDDENLSAELKEEPAIRIDLSYDKTTLKTDDVVTADVHVKYIGEGKVNYAIVDLGIPPGFSLVAEDLAKARQDGVIEKFEMTGRQIILYLENLDQQGIRLRYRLQAKYPLKAKTQKSSVYDYYNPDLRDEVEPVEMIVL